MATYLILIYGVEDQWEAMSDHEQEALTAGHRTLAADAGPAILYTCELDPVRRATTLHSDGAGGVLVHAGPFADQRATIGGLYLLDAADDEAALGFAEHLYEATVAHSAVEVRRVAGSP